MEQLRRLLPLIEIKERYLPKAEDGRERVNGFSIGVELLGTQESGFTDQQYLALASLTKLLQTRYDLKNFYGHSDIAPGRKTDPDGFDWKKFKDLIGFRSDRHSGPE